MTLDSTFWTSNDAAPFARAPGAGLRGIRPRVADIGFESGFAAEAVEADFERGTVVTAKGPFTVTKKPVSEGEIPSALIQLYFTDRGSINQAQLDQGIFTPLKLAGFRMSVGTKFEAVPVQWAWRKQAAADRYTKDLYFPVVVSPQSLSGMVYSGSAISSAELMDANFAPNADLLARLPKMLWVYTFAVTNQNYEFTDGDGAQVLAVLKSAWSKTLPSAGASAYGHITMRGADPSVFGLSVTPDSSKDKNTGLLWLLALAAAAVTLG